MHIYINKTAKVSNNYKRTYYPFENARTALKAFLKAVNPDSKRKVLLPAYLGWSDREGSGVFDPIRELALEYEFYKLDERLCIDINDFQRIVVSNSNSVVVIIHYFGYVDPNYEEVVRIAKSNGLIILEDEAHAMFTDQIGGISGRFGDASVYSIHKLLPKTKGGLLVFNADFDNKIEKIEFLDDQITLPWEYDLTTISNKRIENAEFIANNLSQFAGEIVALKNLKKGEVPQTYPVIISNVSRDKLYFMMNESGYGVVSLYHNLIKPITIDNYPNSHAISDKILNLPIHQDVGNKELKAMLDKLKQCVDMCLEDNV